MSRRADAEKKLVDRIAERTGQEIAAACREEIEAERRAATAQAAIYHLREMERPDNAE